MGDGMIISFLGHSDFREDARIKERLLFLLRREARGEDVSFFLGGYGGFDAFARRCAKEYQKENPLCSLVFVTPYLITAQREEGTRGKEYDEVLYPPLESVPPRYAISHRNRYMAERADLIVAYVAHKWGGAYQALTHARRLNKRIINLAEEE